MINGQEGSLGRTSLRYLRRLIWRRLQVSMTERMAAIFGPASGLPICNQFLRPTARPRMAFSQRF